MSVDSIVQAPSPQQANVFTAACCSLLAACSVQGVDVALAAKVVVVVVVGHLVVVVVGHLSSHCRRMFCVKVGLLIQQQRQQVGVAVMGQAWWVPLSAATVFKSDKYVT